MVRFLAGARRLSSRPLLTGQCASARPRILGHGASNAEGSHRSCIERWLRLTGALQRTTRTRTPAAQIAAIFLSGIIFASTAAASVEDKFRLEAQKRPPQNLDELGAFACRQLMDVIRGERPTQQIERNNEIYRQYRISGDVVITTSAQQYEVIDFVDAPMKALIAADLLPAPLELRSQFDSVFGKPDKTDGNVSTYYPTKLESITIELHSQGEQVTRIEWACH